MWERQSYELGMTTEHRHNRKAEVAGMGSWVMNTQGWKEKRKAGEENDTGENRKIVMKTEEKQE